MFGVVFGCVLLFTVVVSIVLRPVGDVVLPPVSSKVLKWILEFRGGVLGGLAGSRGGYKPLFISMLYRGGRPLYSTGSGVVGVRGGEVLWGRVGVVVGDPGRVLDEVFELGGTYSTPYGRFSLEVYEASVEPVSSLGLGEPTGYLRIFARTPVVLSNKILVPGDPDAAKRIPQLHRLTPSPGLIAAYLLRLWNRVAGPGLAFYWRDGWNHDAAMVARAAEVYMAEVDYNVRPETVIIGKTSDGRLRRTRGWKGWIVYHVAGKRLARFLDKTLALATRIGLGRSRGIGLGDIYAEWVQPKKQTPGQDQEKTQNQTTQRDQAT